MGDAALSANLRVGGFGLQPEQVQNYAFQRAAALHLANEWHIPAATDAEIKQEIETLRMFAGADGKFDPKAYSTFRDNLKANPRGLSAADVRRVISDDIRMEKVQQLLAGPGYVLPSDVKNQLERADTSWTLATASIDYAAYNPDIKPSDADLTAFFEQSGSRYDIPPRVVVSYVDFLATNYLDKVSVTEADVRAFYDANPSRFPKPADATKSATPTPSVSPTTDASADFAAVRPQVEAALKLEQAQKLAVREASDLRVALYEKNAHTLEAIEAVLAQRNLTPKTLAPFTRDNPPAEFGGSHEVAEQAFRLNQERVASEATATPNGAVIVFWKETLPSQKPLFTQVREQVAKDYVENEKRKRFVELGKTVKTQLEARLKAGDDFEKAVNAAVANTGLKAETKTLAEFTPRNRPQDVDYSVLGALERLQKGDVSDMIMTGDKGLFVYAIDKKAPDTSEANPRFVETRNSIAQYTAQLGASAYISELIEREFKKSEPKAE